MGDKLISGIFGFATAVVGVGLIAVLVSRNANTSSVITSAGGAAGALLSVAEAPVSGSWGISGGAPIEENYG